MREFLAIQKENPMFVRAVEKCRLVRPRVCLGLSADVGASYLVLRSDGERWASVLVTRALSGRPCVSCDCPAGRSAHYCYHVAAALSVHCGLVRAGLRVPVSSSLFAL